MQECFEIPQFTIKQNALGVANILEAYRLNLEMLNFIKLHLRNVWKIS